MLEHDLPLLTTVAVGFSAAFLFGLIAAKLKLSPIVGYLIAGISIGPYTPGIVADAKIAEQLSEIGILLLMFGVGLHFSFRDLMGVRRIAVPGAIVQILVATGLGAALSWLWGWSLPSGLMLGLALSVASTVVLLRSLEEHNLMQSTDANIAIGWLIVEDIVMVLALVMIPVLASLDFSGGQAVGVILPELAFALGKVALFIAFMLILGRRMLPWLLMAVMRTRSRELFTLGVFAVAMGVAFGAAKLFGVSFALGAFFAGMTIRESELSQQAAEKALPLQDAFAVLFFVSVGMLFNPMIILEQPLQVLGVLAIIVFGKSLASFVIVLLFRYPLKTALLVSAGLAQIGEFSFILANIGVLYGFFNDAARDLILAGALISIAMNPFFFFTSRIIYQFAEKHSPHRFQPQVQAPALEKHSYPPAFAILVGGGRIGRHLLQNIRGLSIDVVTLDANRERVDQLRRDGFPAIAGDGTHPDSLRDAGIDKASALVIAVPNPFEARKIAEAARELRPDIKLLVRAHNDEEMQYFEEQKVDLAVMGAREVASRMAQFLYLLHDKEKGASLPYGGA